MSTRSRGKAEMTCFRIWAGIMSTNSPLFRSQRSTLAFIVVAFSAASFLLFIPLALEKPGHLRSEVALLLSTANSAVAMPVLVTVTMLNFPLGCCLSVGLALAQRISMSKASIRLRLAWLALIPLIVLAVIAASIPESQRPVLVALSSGYKVFGSWILPVLCLWYIPAISLYAASVVLE